MCFQYGISPAKQGKAEVCIKFGVDKEGVLTVVARENRFFTMNVKSGMM
jgi:molecular chaperone DnaK (HSP70)